MAEYIYRVAVDWVPIMGGDALDDTIHAIAENEMQALDMARDRCAKFPLYPLSCWTPMNFRAYQKWPRGIDEARCTE
jgi:uncharacterized ferritin-like protein (DUF455 family)